MPADNVDTAAKPIIIKADGSEKRKSDSGQPSQVEPSSKKPKTTESSKHAPEPSRENNPKDQPGKGQYTKWQKESSEPADLEFGNAPPPDTIPEFDLTKMEFPSTSVWASKRNSGKTHLARHMLYTVAQKFKLVVVFSDTAHLSGDWDCMPNCCIKSFTEARAEAILKLGGEWRKKTGKDGSQILIIFDDPTLDDHGSKTMGKIFSKGRHSNISLWLLVQFVRGYFSPVLRQNSDYIFINNINLDACTTLKENVLWSGNSRDFYIFIRRALLGKPYAFLIFDNLTTTDSKWFTVCAPEEVPQFKLQVRRPRQLVAATEQRGPRMQYAPDTDFQQRTNSKTPYHRTL